MTTLHYGSQFFELAEESVQDVADRITAQLTAAGGWVEIDTEDGPVVILIAAGIPIWLDRRRYGGPQVF